LIYCGSILKTGRWVLHNNKSKVWDGLISTNLLWTYFLSEWLIVMWCSNFSCFVILPLSSSLKGLLSFTLLIPPLCVHFYSFPFVPSVTLGIPSMNSFFSCRLTRKKARDMNKNIIKAHKQRLWLFEICPACFSFMLLSDAEKV